ncbi:CPBP family intramembrane glutamic endopeptidase [Mesobacillus subterraneus]|uniref:CPBP family intramembrane glutamic endopeptidase n=1 Tax=Mesobacillus subterraneus TaxID=285983 RepID=UPI00203D0EC3|nr:CPBP family intramembrane glutamic endopeptidase [Mesobacillus subterraneus]MCM3685311.1 CPBP family intramembrane metalloprotease [Mesobacillus subterraneus]
MTLIVVFVGFGLGSLINDIIVRGLVFNFFKDRVPLVKLMVIAILLYALDDIWLEGFSINNTIFSIVLGLSLTYAFYTTNSIWANTGIHVGLNVVYGLFYGVSGKVGDGVFLFDVNEKANGFFSSYLSIIIACIMFLMVYRFLPVLTSVSSETDNRAGFLNKNA